MTTFYTNIAIVKLQICVCVCLENLFIKQFFSFKAFREIFQLEIKYYINMYINCVARASCDIC